MSWQRDRPRRPITWRERFGFLAILGLVTFVIGTVEIFAWNPFSPPDWSAWGWVIGPFVVGALCLFGELVVVPALEPIFGVDRVEDPVWRRALRVLGVLMILAIVFVVANELEQAGWF